MSKEKSTMQFQKTFSFDEKPAVKESKHVATDTSLPPPLIRPDRQETFDGKPHYQWPSSKHDKDIITVDRLSTSQPDYRFTIIRGDTAEAFFSPDKKEIGIVTGISHAKNEVGVSFAGNSNSIWFNKGAIYPAPEPAPEPIGIPLFKLLSTVSQEPQGGFSDADIVLPIYTFDDYKDFRNQMVEGTLSFEDYHLHFKRLCSSKDVIVEELQSQNNAKQLKVMASRFGEWDARRNTKPKNAESIHKKMMLSFVLGGTILYSMEISYEQAVRDKVQAVTQEDLASAIAEARSSKAEHEKTLSNPETLDEFRTFLQYKTIDEMSDKQLAIYDRLESDYTRDNRAANQKTTVQQFQAEEAHEVEFSVKEGCHDKKLIPLWIVQLASRVERSTFMELKTKAKMLGGWYSSFKRSDAGFQFKSIEDANQFTSLLTGDADRSDVFERRKERKQLSAAERLEELADELFKRAAATVIRSKESLQNTVRRAGIQESIRGRAYKDQALAHTIVSISDALHSGDAKYLDGIRHKSHVELLQSILYRAKWKHIHTLKKGGGESDYDFRYRKSNEDDRLPNLSDTRFAVYPFPTIYKRHLEEAIAKCSNSKGVKLASQKMAKRIRNADEYVLFRESYDIAKLEDFLGRAKSVGFNTPWLQHGVDEYNRLKRAKIDTIHELRSALRELIPHIAATRGDDAVEIAERELIGKKLDGFFPTPKGIIRNMLELADIKDHHRVLEPSAGKGDILDALRDGYPDANRHGIEMNHSLQDVLQAKGHEVEFTDFLQHEETYDRIVMNPPFEKGQDIEHVQHAYKLLQPGGRVVSIMGEGAFFRADKKATEFRQWLEEVDGIVEKLPEDTFKSVKSFRQTGVRTRLVVIDFHIN